MRLTLVTKLFLAFLAILGVSLIPGHYLLVQWKKTTLSLLEQRAVHDINVAVESLSTVRTNERKEALHRLSESIGFRLSIFTLDRQWIEDSHPITSFDIDPDSEELTDLFQSTVSYGKSLRTNSRGELFLYITKLLVNPNHQVEIVRLSYPLPGHTFRRLDTLERIIAGIGASVLLVLLLLLFGLTTRRLHRIRQHMEGLVEGEYHRSLSIPFHDEIGDLANSLNELQRRLQKEGLAHSILSASFTELLRELPLPTAILQSDFGLRYANAAFRKAASISPATEHGQFHTLRNTAEFRDACTEARRTRIAKHVLVSLPWLPQKIALHVCPLPIAEGAVEWAIFVHDLQVLVPLRLREASQLFKPFLTNLDNDSQRPLSVLEAATLKELRITTHLVQCMIEPNELDNISPLSLESLKEMVSNEIIPVYRDRELELLIGTVPSDIMIADASHRTLWVIAMALLRIGRTSPGKEYTTSRHPVHIQINISETTVSLQILGTYDPIEYEDLHRLLSPLGGEVLCREDRRATSQANQPLTLRTQEQEVWIHLRRA